jgi:fatty-acyl-CoA synthase
MYNNDLEQNSANHQPLSPLPFLERAASVFPIMWLLSTVM